MNLDFILEKKMTNILLNSKIETVYCDCCGSYDNETLEVFIDGNLFKSYYKDGHFGSSYFEENEVLVEILEQMGNSVIRRETYY